MRVVCGHHDESLVAQAELQENERSQNESMRATSTICPQ